MAKNVTNYVDGFVLVIPKKNLAQYRKMAKEGAKAWMKHGAIDYKECMGDDLTPDMGAGQMLTFPQMIGATKDDTVWFSYITFKSRAHRDQVNKKVMAEMSKNYEGKEMTMPFDMKKTAIGGFKVIVSG